MNLRKKKQLAAQVLKVGKKRICLNNEALAEIKEAITKQDIKDLYKDGIILIKPIKGKKKIKRRKTKRGPGKIKKKIKHRKQDYVKITKKLRAYLKQLKSQRKIDNELFLKLRKKIRMRDFRSKMHLKEYLGGIEGLDLNKIVKIEKPTKISEIKKETKKKIEKIKVKEKK